MASKNSGVSQNSECPDGRYVSVYSLVDGALEDDEIFPETDDGLVMADVFLADLVRKLKADCQCPWEVWTGVCYVEGDFIEGSQWADDLPELFASGDGQ
jgi:hypothetical protein